ncbi:hypothetical protein M3201_07045 [Paenibacillus motobuensis]|uniref:hypothetical protein n=1 Tax=Paenibacillus TaxID=44249 RepID=UPI00203A8695|nr:MULTISPECIES: hypothetical protein [Paenibacillus]MCM3039457.1 hypothetical protein [Paenibacillus lutimineralis]MCM3646561.1 hypothetical protein [Paenibacillus motobuensis]
MNHLSGIKLRKDSAKGYSGDEYEIWFQTWSGPTFGIRYDRPDYLRIYNGSSNQKKYSWEYEIEYRIVDRIISIIDPSGTLRNQYLGATSYETLI